MSVANAISAIKSWAEQSGISNEDGRDLSPFLTAALLVAASDGELDAGELRQLNSIQAALTGGELSDEDLEAEINYIVENGADGSIDAVASAIEDHDERGFAVAFAAIMAAAQRGVNANEGAMLQRLGQGLGFSQLDVQKILGQAMLAVRG